MNRIRQNVLQLIEDGAFYSIGVSSFNDYFNMGNPTNLFTNSYVNDEKSHLNSFNNIVGISIFVVDKNWNSYRYMLDVKIYSALDET